VGAALKISGKIMALVAILQHQQQTGEAFGIVIVLCNCQRI